MADYVLIGNGILRGGGSKRFLQSSDYFALAFDAVTSIDATFTASVTSHPVDTKANISDHIIQENEKFSINCIVSDSPINQAAYEGNFIDYGSPPPSTLNGVSNSDTSENQMRKRGVDALNKLKKIKDMGAFVTFATEFGIYPNCVITSISTTITPESVNAYTFKIDLEKIKLVSAQTVSVIVTPTAGNGKSGDKAKETANKKSEGKTEEEPNDFLADDVLAKIRTRSNEINKQSAEDAAALEVE